MNLFSCCFKLVMYTVFLEICDPVKFRHKDIGDFSVKKWAKDLNRHFFKEDIERVQRRMKGRSVSLAIREMKIKITMRYHFTLVRMAIINKATNNTC